MTIRSRLSIFVLGLALSCGGWAQPATQAQREGVAPNPAFRTLHFRTSLGSFKLIDGQGRAELSFTGTILVVNLEGKLTTKGELTQQYDERGRKAFFGRGTIIVTGKWRGIQCFGREIRGTWFGQGIAHVSGDFDRNLETGWFWYDDPTKREAFPSQGIRTVFLPDATSQAPQVVPRARDEAAPKGKR